MARKDRKRSLLRRHRRIRKRITGTPERPRLFVRRSNRNLQASLIDDLAGKTLLTLTTASREFQSEESGDKKAQAGRLGALMAEKAKEKGIEKVVFDRGGHPYHGRVRVFAEKAREGGLKF